MADHTLNALRAAARAMDEVVIGAIDPGHPLANEQARLVSRYLALIVERLDYAGDRNRFELSHYLNVAKALQADAQRLSPAVADALHEASAEGYRLLEAAESRPSAWQAGAQRLAAVVTALVRTAGDAEPEIRQRIEAFVLTASADLLAAQRSWFLPQGWEPDACAVPPIESALRITRAD